jgi:hypothetical protein
MLVKFKNVGRNNKSWQAECKGKLTFKFMYDQCKKNAAIMSKDIDFTDDWEIIAGGRKVGTFEIIHQTEEVHPK